MIWQRHRPWSGPLCLARLAGVEPEVVCDLDRGHDPPHEGLLGDLVATWVPLAPPPDEERHVEADQVVVEKAVAPDPLGLAEDVGQTERGGPETVSSDEFLQACRVVRRNGYAVVDPEALSAAQDRLAGTTDEAAPEGDNSLRLAWDRERIEALEGALEWIEGCEHQPGCSGQWPPHRCKCDRAGVLAACRAALGRHPVGTDRDETGHVPGCPAWIAPGDECECGARPLAPPPDEEPCPTCHGRGCEEGCGSCHMNPTVAGPDAHRQCITCHGSGLAPPPDEETAT